jgi:hypothetical protein
MGCCEVHSSDNYLSVTRLHPSILMKEKRNSSQSKRVRFEISFNNYKNLTIQEEEPPDWYSSILSTDFSTWEKYSNSTFADLYYIVNDGKLFTAVKVELTFEINHETIICLINNPKYRIAWDLNLRKMEILFGDCSLDAMIEMIEMGNESIKLLERKVRKFGDSVCCFYVPLKDETLDSYFLVSLIEKKTIVCYFKENLEEDFLPLVNQKLLWATRLIEEVLIYKKN